MTDFVQQAATQATQRPGLSNVDIDAENRLTLKENPTTVFVKLVPDADGKPVPGFASDPNGPYALGGLSWGSSSDRSMFVTFSYTSPVTGIECDLPYSPMFGPDQSLQNLCIVPAREARVTYQFFVLVSGGPKHDPKIVVTPIDGGEVVPGRS